MPDEPRRPGRLATIDLAPWRVYLAAFDELLAAQRARDVRGMDFARRLMLRELDGETLARFYARRVHQRAERRAA